MKQFKAIPLTPRPIGATVRRRQPEEQQRRGAAQRRHCGAATGTPSRPRGAFRFAPAVRPAREPARGARNNPAGERGQPKDSKKIDQFNQHNGPA
jgi:hypothetical protein